MTPPPAGSMASRCAAARIALTDAAHHFQEAEPAKDSAAHQAWSWGMEALRGLYRQFEGEIAAGEVATC